ncbi:toprim domain-containing protein [Flavobacterium seoulense]|uniref:DNA primase n=1 Tax=Flavobacterium seoulense TaxID=1492738 RepID=A0A066WUP0_9FLAO|nr:toprim domain-containing protein [Flavobacterium seoulense]KDN54689.1 DNA primase [Flavobacterium seoulense]
MNFSSNKITLNQAKEIDLVIYLSNLGFEPSKIRNNDYWYLSPLRNEKEASFKINRRLNRWYDHGLGKGGNLIDFGILYFNCTISELLKNLSGNFSFQQPKIQYQEYTIVQEQKIKILTETALTSPSLLHYLEYRSIPIEIAQKYCVEIRYTLNEKNYFGIGFKNDLGGFEIRTPYFKTSSSPKGITTISNCNNEVIVFEGFMDFLSFRAMTKNLPESSQDFVILNSISFFERARPFMENYDSIRLYFDRDETGLNYTSRALSLSTKYCDKSQLYQNYKDLNDWAMSFGKAEKSHLDQKQKH